MTTLNDVLINRDMYPDTQEIDFLGQKVTLKHLREELIPKGDMTRATQKLSDEKRQLEQNVVDLQQAYSGLQGQLSELMSARRSDPTAPATPRSAFADLEADPILGPVVVELRAVRAELAKAHEANETLSKRQVEMATTYLQDQYRIRIAKLQADDASLDPKALIDFAVSRNMPDVEMAYRLMTEDRRLKQREADAEKRGYDKGKQEVTLVPPISSGRRMTVAPPPEGVKDFEQAKQAALDDPAIERLWAGVPSP